MSNKDRIWDEFNSEWKHPIAGTLTMGLGLGLVVFAVGAFVMFGLGAPDWIAVVIAAVFIPPSALVLSYVLRRFGL